MKRLGPLDAAWLQVDSRETPMQVASLTIYSLPRGAGPDFLQNLVTLLKTPDRLGPPFSLKLGAKVLRHLAPVMVEDPNVDLDYHVRHSSLPRPGGERELGILVSRLHSHPMDFSRPLWECHVIEGLENDRFALYVKVHHALVDGVGGMRLTQKMLSFDPDVTDLPPPWARRDDAPRERPPRLPALQRIGNTLREQVRTVPEVTRALRGLVGEWWKNDAASDAAVPFRAPKSVLNGRISGQRRFATQHYALDRIRQVARAGEATVNDVFLAMCGGALRRYLSELRILPDEALTAGIPVSVRPQDSDSNDAGNAISFIVSTLATQLDDPLERLAAIRQSTRQAKGKLQALPKTAIANYTIVLMAPYILQMLTGLAGRARPMFNLTVSNVPGPERPMYFNGARMEQMYPVSLLSHGQALNITVMSYAGQFNVGITGCRDTLPHMQRLAVYMGDALAEMEKALGIPPLAEEAPAPAPPARKRARRNKAA